MSRNPRSSNGTWEALPWPSSLKRDLDAHVLQLGRAGDAYLQSAVGCDAGLAPVLGHGLLAEGAKLGWVLDRIDAHGASILPPAAAAWASKHASQ